MREEWDVPAPSPPSWRWSFPPALAPRLGVAAVAMAAVVAVVLAARPLHEATLPSFLPSAATRQLVADDIRPEAPAMRAKQSGQNSGPAEANGPLPTAAVGLTAPASAPGAAEPERRMVLRERVRPVAGERVTPGRRVVRPVRPGRAGDRPVIVRAAMRRADAMPARTPVAPGLFSLTVVSYAPFRGADVQTP